LIELMPLSAASSVLMVADAVEQVAEIAGPVGQC
jgi:hypothetical protein